MVNNASQSKTCTHTSETPNGGQLTEGSRERYTILGWKLLRGLEISHVFVVLSGRCGTVVELARSIRMRNEEVF